MSISFPCSCGNWLTAESEAAGQAVICPTCRAAQVVPSTSASKPATGTIPSWLEGVRRAEAAAGPRPGSKPVKSSIPAWVEEIRRVENEKRQAVELPEWVTQIQSGSTNEPATETRMPAETSPSQAERFVQAVAAAGVLAEERLVHLRQHPLATGTSYRPLAEEIVRSGLLTRFQVREIASGRGRELCFGPYILLEMLGQGAMAKVYKAVHRETGQIVALKIMHKEKQENPASVRRFLREIKNATQLDHPNIVRAFDSGQLEDSYYIAMEFLDGADLSRIVKKFGALPIDRACDFIRQAALGLQHAFERGMVHRDIKPANLMITRTDNEEELPTVKILDMGLARDLGSSPESDLTCMGRVVGTPRLSCS
ncbi:MAG: hypothetical protein KatS3mg105_4365 [Gemmatales bacterium]|nr:MAG: hypothetical protein KatS3mg105_4365 [Gemmatales bacterium]